MKTYTHLLWLGLLLFCNYTYAQMCTAHFSYVVEGFTAYVINESAAEVPRPHYIVTSNGLSILKDETFDTTAFHYTSPGVYAIMLDMYDGDSLEECNSVFVDSVTIVEPPVCIAHFSYTVTGFDVVITNESSAAIPHPNYLITSDGDSIFKDETFDLASIHYTHAGVFAITLEMYDGDSLANCSSTFIDSVEIIAPPVCDAMILDKYPTFSSISDGITPTTTYYWNFGDGATSTLQNPVHAYATAGLYTLYLVIQDTATGCNDTAFLERYFYPTSCKGAILYQQDSNVVHFTPKFIPMVFSPSSITWDYGDGTTGTVAYHQYDTTGTYLVCCVATDTNLNCTTSNICKWVDVICNIDCTPEFTYSGVCGLVTFENGIIYTPPSTTFLWNFGDGTTGEGINTQHDYAIEIGVTKTYNTCLELRDGNTCLESICHTVEVSCITTGIQVNTKPKLEISNLQLFPVPFTDELHLNFTVNQHTPITLSIYDCLGQKVVERTLQNQAIGERNLTLNSNDLAKGLYILKMTTRNGQLTRQLVKQ